MSHLSVSYYEQIKLNFIVLEQTLSDDFKLLNY
jgi:hypothetical protein